MVFKDKKFPHQYIPTIFENHVCELRVDDKLVQLQLVDTAGQEGYDRLRPLSYPSADVIVLCFSIAHPPSFNNIEVKWITEVRHHCPRIPVILVGNKSDLRCDEKALLKLAERNMKPISVQDGMEMAKRIKAEAYVECSAFNQEGVQEVFQVATRATFAKRPKRGRNLKCRIV